jgi:hypothetical protein
VGGVPVVLLTLLGCGQGTALPGLLPSELSLVVRKGDGSYASMLVPLEKNARREVDVRIASGVRVFDGDHLWNFETERGDDGWIVKVHDGLSRAKTSFTVPGRTEPTVEGVAQGRVWVRASEGLLDCVFETGTCQATAWMPEFNLHRPGPGSGFDIEINDAGEVWLRLPLDGEEAPGSMLLADVEQIIAVRWVHRILPLDRDDLNRSFRGRGLIEAVDVDVVVDGDMAEWADARPLVVDARWQVDLGIDGWQNDRDGSFGVAASWVGERLCVGVRVRDDAVGPGDRLVIQIAGIPREIDLHRPSTSTHTAVTPVWFGPAVESCFASVPPRQGEALPFTVTLVDTDPGASTSVLRAAPYGDDGAPLGGIIAPRRTGS